MKTPVRPDRPKRDGAARPDKDRFRRDERPGASKGPGKGASKGPGKGFGAKGFGAKGFGAKTGREGGDERRPGAGKDKPARPLSTAPGMEARRVALEILDRVQEGAALDDAIAHTRPFEHLEGPDRAFARLIAAETLRRRGSIDHLIGGYLDRPLPKKNARVMDILRIAAAQLLVLETPAHAAVSTSVELANERGETAGYASLINAIARKLGEAGRAALDALPARTDTPSWMWRGWERAWGPVGAKAIAEAHRRTPPLDLTFKPGEDPGAWRDRFADAGFTVALNPGGGLRLQQAGEITALPGFEDGAWWVQDLAASLPVRLMGDVAGKTVYDLCAAPGGKTLQLAAAGARVTAVDKSPARLERVSENLARTKLTADLVAEDALRFRPEAKADAILVDAPCTATGTIRRHPDIPWSKGETALAALVDLQARMIDHAITLLKPGGLLVFCVCSLQQEEGEKQAKAALARHPRLDRAAVAAAEIDGLAAVTRDGDLRTLPSMMAETGGMDGFFAARFRIRE